MKLQEWAKEHEPIKDMIYYHGYWDQIVFIRDQIKYLIEDVLNKKEVEITVIGDHLSKSIVLPVYQIKVEELNLQFILRYNFSDWKVSVDSELPIGCDFDNLFDGEERWSSLYCEGFEEKWVYDSFNKNKTNFTIEIQNKYHLFTFFWVFLQEIKKSQNI